MKIVHITTVDISLEALLFNQLVSLQKAGYDVSTLSSPGPAAEKLSTVHIAHFPVHISREISPVRDMIALWQIYRLLRRGKFALVHTHTPKPGLLGQMAARLAGVPIVVNTLHGFYFHDQMSPLKRRFYIEVERFSARFSDVILSQNAEDIETAIAEGIAPATKIRYLGNGIDLKRFNPAAISDDQIAAEKKRLNIPPDACVIGFVGRLAARRKGFLDFLSAAQLLVEQGLKVRFLIVGSPDIGKLDAVDASVAADYGIENQCLFLGQQSNESLPLLYRLMNVLVLPSLYEGIPRVLMEGTAMGVPLVATDVRGNREVVVNGRNGLLVPLGKPEALAAAVLDIVRNPDKAERMGGCGVAMAREKFDEEIIFARVKAEYQRLLKQKIPSGQVEWTNA